jgi:hypothetical protein
MEYLTLKDPTWKWVAIVGTLVVSAAVLAVLHLTPNRLKRAVTVGVTFLAGGFYVLAFLVPPNPATQKNFLSGGVELLGQFAQVVVGFTILLGTYNLGRIHLNRIARKREGWWYSIVFFVAFFAMSIAAFWRDWGDWFPQPVPPPAWIKAPGPGRMDLYTILFNGLLRNLEATMFSILAFYIVSAAYRAFRIRSLESAILMLTAVLLMLGQVPIGTMLTAWINPDGPFSSLRVENVSQWVLTTINAPVQRAIGFGLSLGQLAMALRIWLSLERGTYFGAEE